MKTIEIEGLKKPIFSWCPEIEQGALDQMVSLARLPFVEHCALMPDAHLGMFCPIGGVVACNGVVVPSFVGSDVGCGIGAFRTNITLDEIKGKEEIIHHAVARSIPMGFSHNTDERKKQMEQRYGDKIGYSYDKFINSEFFNIVNRKEFAPQLGTLGGG